MRILVVDDDQHIRETLGLVLVSFGHSPIPAATIEEAMLSLPQVKPHVVLLDLLMDGALSVPLIDATRQVLSDHKPTIIIMSAMTGAKAIAEAHQVGFLAKPFDLDDLKGLLDKIKRPEA